MLDVARSVESEGEWSVGVSGRELPVGPVWETVLSPEVARAVHAPPVTVQSLTAQTGAENIFKNKYKLY